MEFVRKQNGVKYVSHNRVSAGLLAVDHADSVLSFQRLYTLLKLTVRPNKVQKTGYKILLDAPSFSLTIIVTGFSPYC